MSDEDICRIANRCSIFYLWQSIVGDPDNDFLIDLAVECQADFIITYNQKDLQDAQNIWTEGSFTQAILANR